MESFEIYILATRGRVGRAMDFPWDSRVTDHRTKNEERTSDAWVTG